MYLIVGYNNPTRNCCIFFNRSTSWDSEFHFYNFLPMYLEWFDKKTHSYCLRLVIRIRNALFDPVFEKKNKPNSLRWEASKDCQTEKKVTTIKWNVFWGPWLWSTQKLGTLWALMGGLTNLRAVGTGVFGQGSRPLPWFCQRKKWNLLLQKTFYY